MKSKAMLILRSFLAVMLTAMLAACVALESFPRVAAPAPLATRPANATHSNPWATSTRTPLEQPLVTLEQVLDHALMFDAQLAVWEHPWSKETLQQDPDRVIIRTSPSRLADGSVSYVSGAEPDAPVWHIAVRGNVRLSSFDADPNTVYDGVVYVISERMGLLAVRGVLQWNVPAIPPTPAPTPTPGDPIYFPPPTAVPLDQPLDTAERALDYLLVIDRTTAQWDHPWSIDTLKSEPGRITMLEFPSRNAECGDCIPSGSDADMGAVWRVTIRGNVYLSMLGIGVEPTQLFDGVTYVISQRTGYLLSIGSGRPIGIDAISAARNLLYAHGLGYDPYRVRIARGVYADFALPGVTGASTPPSQAVYVVWFEANFLYDGVFASDVYVCFDLATGQALWVVARPAPIEELSARPWENVYRNDVTQYHIPFGSDASPEVDPAADPAKP